MPGQFSLPITSAVKQANDDNAEFFHRESNCYPSLETNNTKAGANILPQMPPLGREIKMTAISFKAFRIGKSNFYSGLCRYLIIDIEKIVLRFWCEYYRTADHFPALCKAA